MTAQMQQMQMQAQQAMEDMSEVSEEIAKEGDLVTIPYEHHHFHYFPNYHHFDPY